MIDRPLIFASFLCENCFIGLALASLLPVQNDTIYQRYDVIIQALVESLNDIMKEELVDSETNQIQIIE